MARALGYGVGNTNGARSFAGKTDTSAPPPRTRALGYGVGNTNGVRSFSGKAIVGISGGVHSLAYHGGLAGPGGLAGLGGGLAS